MATRGKPPDEFRFPPERRAAAKARCEAATLGPWETCDYGVLTSWEYHRTKKAGTPAKAGKYTQKPMKLPVVLTTCPLSAFPMLRRNCDFIATARTDLPDALAEIERLEAEVAALRAQLEVSGG